MVGTGKGGFQMRRRKTSRPDFNVRLFEGACTICEAMNEANDRNSRETYFNVRPVYLVEVRHETLKHIRILVLIHCACSESPSRKCERKM